MFTTPNLIFATLKKPTAQLPDFIYKEVHNMVLVYVCQEWVKSKRTVNRK